MVWFLLPSSRFPHPLPVIDLIAICLQLVIDIGGIIGNISVVLAIVLRSPASWRSFRILLVKQAVVDLAATVACNFIIERMIPAPFGTAMVYLGPCVIVSPFACHVGHSVMMNAQTYSIYIVATSFFYRLYILKHKTPSPRMMAGICSAMLILPICMFTLTYLTIDDEAEVREAFRAIYDLDDYVVQGHLAAHTRKAIKISTIYNAGSCLPVTITVFIVRRKVLNTLDRKQSKMSVKSLQIHKILVKVLTLQACLPALYTLTIACYFIMKRDLHHSPTLEHTIRVPVSLMTFVSPYISIFNIKIFRDFVLCRTRKTMVKFSLTAV